LAYEEEIFVEIITPTRLSPFALDPVLESAAKSGRLLAVEEGAYSLGWGRRSYWRKPPKRSAPACGCGAPGRPRPAHPAAGALEQAVLPGVNEIAAAARRMARTI